MTRESGSYWWTTYSPDQASIASGGDKSGAAAVYVGSADGSGWDALDIPSPVTTEDVTWSPDGTATLVFSGDPAFAELLLVPVDDPEATVAIQTGGSVGSPSWQRIAP